MFKITLITSLSLFLTAAPIYANAGPETPTPGECANRLESLPIFRPTRLALLKLRWGSLRADFTDNLRREGRGFAVGAFVGQIAGLMSPASDFEEVVIAIPGEDFLRAHFENVARVIETIETQARRLGLTAELSREPANPYGGMMLSPNGAIALSLDREGTLIVHTPLGDVVVYQKLDPATAGGLLAAVGEWLDLIEVLPETADGFLLGKAYAVVGLPDKSSLPFPVVIGSNATLPPRDALMNAWNRTKPPGRRDMPPPRPREYVRLGWGDL